MLFSSLVLSQVVSDSQSFDTGTIFRVRGPLELKCQLDSTDGTFMAVYIVTKWFPKLDIIRLSGSLATAQVY